MDIVFVSNYFNHHQKAVSDRLYALTQQKGGSYCFIQTEEMEEERIRMGWDPSLQRTSYVLHYWEAPKACQRRIDDSDVTIFGGTEEERYIQGRLKEKKLIFRYSESIYKTGRYKFVSPRGLRKKFLDHTRYWNSPVYLLCAGAYVAGDFRLVLAYPFKKYKYGYFPECKSYDIEELFAKKRKNDGCVRMLWAARMISWKHPEVPVRLAAKLKEKGFRFHLTMAGDGALSETVRHMAEAYRAEDVISFIGSQNPDRIRSIMEESEIYLATSDREEGWGAVINEAMNSGCAVIANSSMGAAPYMIRHGENGFLYPNKKEDILLEETVRLLQDQALRESVGKGAYAAVERLWNGETAADRLYAFAEAALKGEAFPVYASGPLSKA